MPNQLFQSIILNIVYTCFHPVEQVNCSRITSTGTCSQKTFKHQKGIHRARRNVKKNSKRISCTSYTSDTLGQTAELKTLELLLPRCKLFQKKKKKRSGSNWTAKGSGAVNVRGMQPMESFNYKVLITFQLWTASIKTSISRWSWVPVQHKTGYRRCEKRQPDVTWEGNFVLV